MGLRSLVIGLAVTGVMASSCASAARDAFVEAYNDEQTSSNDEACRVESRTLATATDAYAAANGAAAASADDLVPGLLVEMPDAWVIEPGGDPVFAPVVGGRCDGFDSDGASASIGQTIVDNIDESQGTTCAVDKRAIETAVETHFAVRGFDATSIDELAEFGVDAELDRWTLQSPAGAGTTAPTVVAIVGGPCDG